jgi:hypothetical protein
VAGHRSATSLNGDEAEILPDRTGQLFILAWGVRAGRRPTHDRPSRPPTPQPVASARDRALIARLYSRTSCKVVSSTTSAADLRDPGVA